ncbi:Late embryogenesis abundant protein [Quillaja saponaria]|uniref:Late embryogenesis abundant protein n=1 Tax=Quillaja saponaria TaxID=32244 RepID=A0AAD7Q2Z4_QUISA|nr:Late embryogenesis abundant protein [Quillaja saponaria]
MSSKDEYVFYAPLPTTPPRQDVIILLPAYRPHRNRHNRCLLRTVTIFLFLLLAAAIFILYPSDPAIRIARLQLNHVQLKSNPKLVLDLSFSLTIKVRNKDLFSFQYDSLDVTVGYRGRELGFVSSKGGRLRARGSSYVNATLDIDGFEVIHDVFYLLEDLAKGVIPFDTDTQVKGKLGLLFFDIPLKARISCEVFVNTNDQTIVHQDCTPWLA